MHTQPVMETVTDLMALRTNPNAAHRLAWSAEGSFGPTERMAFWKWFLYASVVPAAEAPRMFIYEPELSSPSHYNPRTHVQMGLAFEELRQRFPTQLAGAKFVDGYSLIPYGPSYDPGQLDQASRAVRAYAFRLPGQTEPKIAVLNAQGEMYLESRVYHPKRPPVSARERNCFDG